MKKVLFFTHGKPQGYRIQQYFPYLEKRGFQVTLLTTDVGFFEFLEHVKGVDVLYIQRILMNPLKLRWVKKHAKRIVYDFDDAVMYGSKGESPTRRKKFAQIIAAADAVLCGNRFLLEEAVQYKDHMVFHVPTVVDIDEYEVKTHRSAEKTVMGWIGSRSTLQYITDMKGTIESLLDEGRMTFKIVADAPPEFTHTGLTFERWQKEKEKTAILSFDAGIMPLKNDIWSQGKCGLKLIQYMAAGLPSVVSPVGVAMEMVEDGINGFLGKDPLGWKQALEDLAQDADLRGRMGRQARNIAEERYSLHVWGPRVSEIIDGL